MTRAWLAVVLAAVALAGGAAGVARAASTNGPTLELTVIQATKTDGSSSIDPKISDLPHSQKPFSEYNVFRLVSRRALHLDATRPLSFPLVNGRTVLVVLDGVTDAAQRRYQLETQISEAGKADFLKSLHVTASENQAFFVGGQSYGGGTLFLELVVRP